MNRPAPHWDMISRTLSGIKFPVVSSQDRENVCIVSKTVRTDKTALSRGPVAAVNRPSGSIQERIRP